MSDVKYVINLLSDLLNILYKINFEPVFFKYAKFNKEDEDVVPIFWNLLNKMSPSQFSNPVENVKIYFASLQYKSIEFYALPNDMLYGSRELLMAFSWLIGSEDIIEKKIKEFISNSVLSEEFCTTENFKCHSDCDLSDLKKIEDLQNYALSTLGKINANVKMISEYNDRISNLMTKVHKETKIKNIHLSVAECFYLKDSSKLNLYLDKINNISNLLELYSDWKFREKHYWNWLTSIIKWKSNNVPRNPINKSNLTDFFKLLQNYVKKLILNEHTNINNINNMLNKEKFTRCLHVSSIKKTKIIDLLKKENLVKEEKCKEKENIDAIFNYIKTLL